jgi:8-oxo-dGTP pyrophosphatase MutT (NUDIX family)
MNSLRKISSGNWSDSVLWELYITNEMPPRELCTAVFCLAVHNDDTIVLTKTKRGWELLGGHLEDRETLEQALFRETHEEGGYTPETYELLGYRKITATKPTPARGGKMYPYPVSYIPYFIAKSSLPLNEIHGDDDEILDSGAFTFSEIQQMNVSGIELINAAIEKATDS